MSFIFTCVSCHSEREEATNRVPTGWASLRTFRDEAFVRHVCDVCKDILLNNNLRELGEAFSDIIRWANHGRNGAWLAETVIDLILDERAHLDPVLLPNEESEVTVLVDKVEEGTPE